MMDSNELIRFGAVELARLIRCGQIDPVEVVDAYISRIEMVNPSINALVTSTFDEARKEARHIRESASAKESDLRPLLGVPFTVKDSLPVAGVRFTAGSTYHRDDVATQDAEAVRRLKAAGGILLGKTNCSDMSSSAETTNLIFGLTRNPWSPDRSAGGSSGGEAALIAAGGSPLGLGADFGGSIRIPSAFCGVVGFKPSGGRIPTDGHIPETPASIRHWNTVGPIARGVEDIALALSVLSDVPVTDCRSIQLKGRRVLVPQFALPVTNEVSASVRSAATALRDVGMVEDHVSLPLMKVALESTAILYKEWFPHLLAALGGGQPIRLWAEFMAHGRNAPRVSRACLNATAMFSLFGPMLRLAGYGRLDSVKKLRDFTLQSMRPDSVLLWPVFPTTAPKHGFAWNPNRSPHYTMVFNGLGFPAIALPVGLSKTGLPLSVQVIGQPNEDETVLAVAAVLEKAFGGWRMPPLASRISEGTDAH